MAGSSQSIGIVAILMSCVLYSHGITVTPTSVNETDGTVTFTVTPDGITNPANNWFLSYTTEDGTAVAGADYISASGTESTPGSTTSIEIDVTIIDNMIYEGDRTFKFTFSSGANIDDPLPQMVTITIVEDEELPVTIQQPFNMTYYESKGVINITIVRESPPDRAFDLDVHLGDGDAEEGVDYELLTSSLSFAMGQNEEILSLSIIDDELMEMKESICIWLNSTDMEEAIAFYIFIKDNDTPQNFLCRRGNSQPCLNNGTCLSDSSCECEDPYTGVNCGIDTDAISMDCDPECVNGTCVGGNCICDPGFAGEACDKKAYYHECSASGFNLCLTPFSVETFEGIMFVVDHMDDPECVLMPAPATADPADDYIDWCKGYVGNIDFNGTCGELGPLEGVNVTTYRLVIYVQYTQNITRYSDEIVTLTCQMSDGVLVTDTSVHTGNGGTGGSPQTGDGEFAPALLSIEDTNGNPVPEQLQFGSIIEVCVSVEEVPAFEAVIIDRIIVDNKREGADFRSLVLYDEGCFPTPGVIVTGPQYIPSNDYHTMCFELEVFIFSHDALLPEALLRVTVEFHVEENHMALVHHTCGKRRRRAAADGGEMLDTTLTLINPDVQQAAPQISNSSATCGHWLVPSFIGLGILCIALVIAIIILTMVVVRRAREKNMPKC